MSYKTEEKKPVLVAASQSDRIGRNLNYSSKIIWETVTNYAFFKIFSDYFNILKCNPKICKEHEITDLTFFRQKEFMNNIELPNYMGETNIRFKWKKILINMSFDRYKQGGEYYYTIFMNSENEIEIRGDEVFKKIRNNAISISNLKGKYIEMNRGEFTWEIKELEKRDLNDIFLPKKLSDDLNLYTDVFFKKDRLMRYLMVGNPGTGKTESTLVLSNILKKGGVTIIKTPIDNHLKDKVEFAEILSPSILIFDDLDLAIGSRSKGGYSPKELQTFLDVMDGTDKISKSVGILATTNSSQLLDLAAQRPGRFEKVLSFDILSKRNIGDIILKSLRYNSDNSKNRTLFFNKKVVDLFFDKGVTGSYVYNSISMLELKSELTDSEINLDWVLEEMNHELKNADQLRGKDHLKLELSREKASLGFGNGNGDGSGEMEEPDYDEISEDDIDLEWPDECAEDQPVHAEEADPAVRRDSSDTR